MDFISKGIAELLKEDKVSHLVILPKFDKKQKRPYITIITKNKANYQELLDNDQYYIALSSMFGSESFNIDAACSLIMEMMKLQSGQHKQKFLNNLIGYL